MTPTEPGFYWAISETDQAREPTVVQVIGRDPEHFSVWMLSNDDSWHLRDFVFLSGPLRFEGTVPAEEKTASELA